MVADVEHLSASVENAHAISLVIGSMQLYDVQLE